MYYKLYIDSIFFIQFVMNLYLLSITGKILKCTATHRRILLGALLGAGMLCLVMAVPAGNLKIRLFIGVIPVSIVMMRVVFLIRTPRLLIKSSFVMAVCGFFLGSAVQWLARCFTWFERWRYGLWTFAFFGFAGYAFLRFLIQRQRSNRECGLKKVRIPDGGENIYINALIDTGNHLAEPVSGAPVCIVSENAAAKIQGFFLPERYHAIPYQSVGRKRGILDAYELPELFIEDTYHEICCKRVIVAICNTGISQDSIYQMILHPALIEN